MQDKEETMNMKTTNAWFLVSVHEKSLRWQHTKVHNDLLII